MPKRKAPSTAWKPGQSGNPEGENGKALTAALRKRAHDPAMDDQGNEIYEVDASGKRRLVKRLDLVADSLLTKAMKGDISSVVEVFNRLDGKVPQAHDIKQQTTVTVHAEAVSDFDRWVTGIAAREANGADSDVGSERPVLPDQVPPKPTRH